MKNLMTNEEIVRIATKTASIMLEAGAETYRIEDLVLRMCRSKNIESANVFIMPTAVIISYDELGERKTSLKRIYTNNINLEIIDSTNEFSRYFTQNNLTYEQAIEGFEKIKKAPRFKWWIETLGISIGSGFFVLMFNGNALDMFLAYLVSCITYGLLYHLKLNPFTRNFVGGILTAGLAVIFVKIISLFNMQSDISKVIIGPLMMLVPGVALTVGIKDLISGEVVSGSSKIAQAMFIFVALAFGVGIVLQIFNF